MRLADLASDINARLGTDEDIHFYVTIEAICSGEGPNKTNDRNDLAVWYNFRARPMAFYI